MSEEEIWNYLSEHLAAGDIVTADSTEGQDTNQDKWGIVKGHAYTVSNVQVLKDGTKLVRARNPWGKDSYMGQYSSESPQAQDPSVVAQIPDI